MITKMEKIEEVLYDAGYSTDYIDKNIEKSIENKAGLKKLLSTSKFWNEEELSICIPIEVPTLAKDLKNIAYGFKQFLVNCYSPAVSDILNKYANEQIIATRAKILDKNPGFFASRAEMQIVLLENANHIGPIQNDLWHNKTGHWIKNYAWHSDNEVILDDNIVMQKLEEKIPNITNVLIAISILKIIPENYGKIENKIKQILETYNSPISPRLKPTKIINRLLKDVELSAEDKKELNRWLARFGEALKPVREEKELKFSIHPLDFLTMSNTISDNGWHSCHTLDITDSDRCYQAGTLSYMLDDVSLVAYTHQPGSDYKDTRTMVFISPNHLLGCHGRIYPQNEGHGELAKIYDKWLESELFPFLERTTDYEERTLDFLSSQQGSCQYPDYCYEYYSTVWGDESLQIIEVGSPYFYCLQCGQETSNDGGEYFEEACLCLECREMSVTRCARCGVRDDLDNMYYIDGEYYCEDCVVYSYYEEDNILYADAQEIFGEFLNQYIYDDIPESVITQIENDYDSRSSRSRALKEYINDNF